VNVPLAFRTGKRRYGFRPRAFGISIALVLLLGTRLAASPQSAVQDDAVVKDFESRVTAYVDLRKKEAGSAPRPTNSPEKIVESQQDLATKIKVLRQDAKQGDIFTPEIADYFRRQISATLTGPHGRKIRASLRHAEPVHIASPKVNQTYPPGIPLQSTPPTLLSNLPALPKELEYRIVGHNLVLHDLAPNIIVDLVADAVPATKE
jgi:hypothetical protein